MTMALVPTPLLTEPFPKSWAMTEAATEAVCCQRTETRTKMDEIKMMARAICETGRDGKGLTSRSDPSESSVSCQPGKVANKMKQTKAKTMAMILFWKVSILSRVEIWAAETALTYIRYGNTIISLNWAASQIRFSGSWSTETSLARAVALLLHSQEPPSALTQMPK